MKQDIIFLLLFLFVNYIICWPINNRTKTSNVTNFSTENTPYDSGNTYSELNNLKWTSSKSMLSPYDQYLANRKSNENKSKTLTTESKTLVQNDTEQSNTTSNTNSTAEGPGNLNAEKSSTYNVDQKVTPNVKDSKSLNATETSTYDVNQKVISNDTLLIPAAKQPLVNNTSNSPAVKPPLMNNGSSNTPNYKLYFGNASTYSSINEPVRNNGYSVPETSRVLADGNSPDNKLYMNNTSVDTTNNQVTIGSGNPNPSPNSLFSNNKVLLDSGQIPSPNPLLANKLVSLGTGNQVPTTNPLPSNNPVALGTGNQIPATNPPLSNNAAVSPLNKPSLNTVNAPSPVNQVLLNGGNRLPEANQPPLPSNTVNSPYNKLYLDNTGAPQPASPVSWIGSNRIPVANQKLLPSNVASSSPYNKPDLNSASAPAPAYQYVNNNPASNQPLIKNYSTNAATNQGQWVNSSSLPGAYQPLLTNSSSSPNSLFYLKNDNQYSPTISALQGNNANNVPTLIKPRIDNTSIASPYNVSTPNTNDPPKDISAPQSEIFLRNSTSRDDILPNKNHASFSTFEGNVSKVELGTVGDENKLNGSHTVNSSNETRQFDMGNRSYTLTNLTKSHNCSGCLNDKNGSMSHKDKFGTLEDGEDIASGSGDGESKPKRCVTSPFSIGAGGQKHITDMLNSDDEIDVPGSNINCIMTATRRRLITTTATRRRLETMTATRRRLITNKHTHHGANSVKDKVSKHVKKTKKDTKQVKQKKERKRRLNDMRKSVLTGTRRRLIRNKHTHSKTTHVDGTEVTTGTRRRLITNKHTHSKTTHVDGTEVTTGTRRRLITNKHTHSKTTHVDGTKSEKDTESKEEEKTKEDAKEEEKNKDRQRLNDNRKQSNEDRSKDLQKLKEKILSGASHHEAEATEPLNPSRDIENQTMVTDASMLPNNQSEKMPDQDHLDADVGIVGMDIHPAIEDPIQKNKTKKIDPSKILTNGNLKRPTNSTITDVKNTTKAAINETSKANKTEPLKKRVLCFGDSITNGFTGENKTRNPYSKKLEQLFEDDKHIEYEVLTHGVNGLCASKEMPDRLQEVLKEEKPLDLVIILAGTNDLLTENCAKDLDLYESIKQLHEIVHSKGIKTVVVTIPEIALTVNGTTTMSRDELKEAWNEVNQKLRLYAATNKKPEQVILSDLADELTRQGGKDGTSIKGMWEDNIHPSVEGYERIGEILYKDVTGKF